VAAEAGCYQECTGLMMEQTERYSSYLQAELDRWETYHGAIR